MTQMAETMLTGSVQHMCFITVNGDSVVVAARTQGIELIDALDGTPLRVVAADRTANAVSALAGAAGRNDTLLAAGTDGTVYGYDPVDGTLVLRRALGAGPVKDIEVYGEAGAQTVAAILDAGLFLWRPGTDGVVRLPNPPERDAARLFKVCGYEQNGRQWLTCAYTDGFLATWDADDPDATPTAQQAHDGPIWSLIDTVDADGQPIVVSGGSDRRMRVWGPTGRLELVAREAFVADGTIRRLGHVSDKSDTMLITASATGSVSLWRLDGPPERPEMEVTRHSGEAWALACANTADGVLIASGDMNGDIRIKRLSTALLTEDSFVLMFQASTTIWAVAHGDTAEGPYVACAGVDQTVNVIDPAMRRDPVALRHHASTVRSLVAAGDRDRPHLISGGADHRVLDWDPHTGRLRAELPVGHEGEVWALATYVDNGVNHVVSGSADGSVRQIALDPEPGPPRIIAADCGEVSAVIVVRGDDGEPIVVVGSGKGLRAVSVRQGTTRALSLAPVGVACGVTDAGRQLIVVARQDGVVQLVDPIAAATVTTFAVSYESGQVRALDTVRVSGSTFVLGGCDDGRILVWHIDGTLVSHPVRGGTAGIRSMNVVEMARPPEPGRPATGATQSALITAGHDGVVRLWPVTVHSPLRSGGSVERGVRPSSVLLQDQPTDRDHLARNPLVETLYDALTSPGTKPPVVVGVHAPWGQGKSSLLRQLQGRVDPWVEDSPSSPSPAPSPERPASHRLVAVAKPGKRPRPVRTHLTRAWAWSQIQRSGDHNAPLAYEMRPREGAGYNAISVWFNPWMYERTDQIWAGLTREILIAVTERLSKPERERLWFDLNLRRTDPAAMRKRILASYIPRTLLGGLLGTALLLTVAITVVATAVTVAQNGTIQALLGTTALAMLTVLGIIAQATSGSFKHIHGWVSPDELNSTAGPEHAWKGATDPLTSTDRGYLYMLQHDVGEVVGLATQHGPLYVFIDDLDRCGPDIVADTIEAINLFLNKAFGQCVFVVALDPATVAAHLETSFKDINERAIQDPASFGHLKHTGWRFMEKIIDLPIRLPRLPDTALSEYLDRLLDPTTPPAPAKIPRQPSSSDSAAAVQATTSAPAPRSRRRGGEPGPAGASIAAAAPLAGESEQTTSVELVVVSDTPTTAASVAVIGQLEALPPVRDALRAAVLSLPGRNPRQTKAFINLWRFYMVLDHRMGLFSPSLLAIERHSIEMARLVELMVRWPYLLDPLGEQAAEGVTDGTTNLDKLLDACASDQDEPWDTAARRARLDPADRAVIGLRELLRQATPHRQVFTSIARRYL